MCLRVSMRFKLGKNLGVVLMVNCDSVNALLLFTSILFTGATISKSSNLNFRLKLMLASVMFL